MVVVPLLSAYRLASHCNHHSHPSPSPTPYCIHLVGCHCSSPQVVVRATSDRTLTIYQIHREGGSDEVLQVVGSIPNCHSSQISMLDFCHTRPGLLFSCSLDGLLKLWDISDISSVSNNTPIAVSSRSTSGGRRNSRRRSKVTSALQHCAVSSDDMFVAVANGSAVRVYHLSELFHMYDHFFDHNKMNIDQDNGGGSPQMSSSPADTSSTDDSIELALYAVCRFHSDNITDLCFHPSTTHLLLSAGSDGLVAITSIQPTSSWCVSRLAGAVGVPGVVGEGVGMSRSESFIRFAAAAQWNNCSDDASVLTQRCTLMTCFSNEESVRTAKIVEVNGRMSNHKRAKTDESSATKNGTDFVMCVSDSDVVSVWKLTGLSGYDGSKDTEQEALRVAGHYDESGDEEDCREKEEAAADEKVAAGGTKRKRDDAFEPLEVDIERVVRCERLRTYGEPWGEQKSRCGHVLSCLYDAKTQRMFVLTGSNEGELTLVHINQESIQLAATFVGHSNFVRNAIAVPDKWRRPKRDETSCDTDESIWRFVTCGDDGRVCLWTQQR
eukprot:GHVS01062471.1.p1 GENE.GHVS01062471.1~~GHVS01062471.1.p1  ORF type:complete len:552 (-),score=100.25 GHVS01062471.1:370-2025(-)